MTTSKYYKKLLRERKEFESREVYPKKGLTKALGPTGYEAYRVSPRKTKKYGKEYRKIYGATVEPEYTRKVPEKKHTYGAKVTWYEHGYTRPSTKPGTKMIMPLKDYPVSQAEARMKLMLKKKKKKKKRIEF